MTKYQMFFYNKTEWVFFTTDVLLTWCSLHYTHQKGCHSSYTQDFRRCLLQISAGILAITNEVFHGFPHFPQATVRIQAHQINSQNISHLVT